MFYICCYKIVKIMDLKIDKYIEEREKEFNRLKKLDEEQSLKIKLLKRLISKFKKLK